MLRRVQIHKFRSCQSVDLTDLDRVTALVGKNGVGKTNILQAIRWLSRYATSINIDTSELGPFDEISISVDIDANDDKFYRFHVATQTNYLSDPSNPLRIHETVSYGSDESAWTTLIERQEEEVLFPTFEEIPTLQINKGTSCLRAVQALLPRSSEVMVHVDSLLKFFDRVRYYPLDEGETPSDETDSGMIISENVYDSWRTGFESTGNAGSSIILRLLHLYLAQEDSFDELCKLLGPDGLDLIDYITISEQTVPESSQDKEVQKQQKFFFIYFVPSAADYENSDRQSFRYSELSLGTRRVLRILTCMIFDQSAVMLLEHPEDGIHSGLTKKVIGIIRDNVEAVQVLMASHSSNVFNTLEPSELRLVSMKNGITDARPLTENELGVAEKFIEDDGPLSDFIESIEE